MEETNISISMEPPINISISKELPINISISLEHPNMQPVCTYVGKRDQYFYLNGTPEYNQDKILECLQDFKTFMFLYICLYLCILCILYRLFIYICVYNAYYTDCIYTMHTIQIKYTMHKYTDTDCGLSGSCLHATLPGLNQPRPLATFISSISYRFLYIYILFVNILADGTNL